MIVFVRHGQTAVNAAGQLQGRVDRELTDLGLTQAGRLAQSLRGAPVARVVTSPLRRAADTARVIADGLGLDIEIDDRLVELDYGEWDQRAFSEIAAAEWDAWRADPKFAPPGGESLVDVTARVASFCDEQLGPELVVAVSHVSPIKGAVCLALGVDERASFRMHLDIASITRIDRRGSDGPAFIASYNETSHLTTSLGSA
ncbi:MAG: histidine phosphatase family protein [Actinomycetota bacterium]|nr:histidine phosphatase family protein [Actinomycetota bacterium]